MKPHRSVRAQRRHEKKMARIWAKKVMARLEKTVALPDPEEHVFVAPPDLKKHVFVWKNRIVGHTWQIQ